MNFKQNFISPDGKIDPAYCALIVVFLDLIGWGVFFRGIYWIWFILSWIDDLIMNLILSLVGTT